MKKRIIEKIFNINKESKGFSIQSINDSYKLTLTNKKFLINIYLFIAIFILTTFTITYTLSELTFKDYLFNYIFYILILSLILVYLIIFQLNYFIITIDKNLIDIKICRRIISTTNPKNHIYLLNEMLTDFSFLKSYFTFNETLIFKIKPDNEEIKTIKLNLLFPSKKEKFRLDRRLKKIIYKNNLQISLKNQTSKNLKI